MDYIEKRRIIDTVLCLYVDIPSWFRRLRLHKYTSLFETLNWKEIIKMDDAQLEARGVAALGARRKMLKTFERVRAHCDAKVTKRNESFIIHECIHMGMILCRTLNTEIVAILVT